MSALIKQTNVKLNSAGRVNQPLTFGMAEIVCVTVNVLLLNKNVMCRLFRHCKKPNLRFTLVLNSRHVILIISFIVSKLDNIFDF